MPFRTAIAITSVALYAGALFADGLAITNTSGKVFANAKIKDVRPDGLKVFHSTGVSLIPFCELPQELQKKYNYDPQAEKEFHRAVAAARERMRQRRAKKDALEAIQKTGVKATLRVLQVTDAGILATGYYVEQEEYEHTTYRTVTKTVGLGGTRINNTVRQRVPVKTEKRTRTTRHKLPERIFLVSSFSNLVDDDSFTSMIFPCGRYQYTTVMGAAATVERYATTSQKAMELFIQDDEPATVIAGGRTRPMAFGTGFIITKEGHILTNFHVVDGGDKLVVKTKGQTFDAKLIATDENNDLAVIQVNAQLSPAKFSAALNPKLGATVFTVGYPMPSLQGIEPKVTKGVVSSLRGLKDDIRLLQIDAAVQPGNSGGPLSDRTGSVVGVINARLNDLGVLQETGSLPQNVNYAIKNTYVKAFLSSVPALTDKLVTGSNGERPFEEAVEEVAESTVLIEVY